MSDKIFLEVSELKQKYEKIEVDLKEIVDLRAEKTLALQGGEKFVHNVFNEQAALEALRNSGLSSGVISATLQDQKLESESGGHFVFVPPDYERAGGINSKMMIKNVNYSIEAQAYNKILEALKNDINDYYSKGGPTINNFNKILKMENIAITAMTSDEWNGI